MSDYEELVCHGCQTPLGWINDCGPRGMEWCNLCKEQNEAERENEEDGIYRVDNMEETS